MPARSAASSAVVISTRPAVASGRRKVPRLEPLGPDGQAVAVPIQDLDAIPSLVDEGGPTIIGTETYDKASVDLRAAQWDRSCFRRQARTSASAVASDCSAYRNVVWRFLCPSRFRIVARLTPPLTSSVACVWRNWWRVQRHPGPGTVARPPLLHRLIPQRATPAVLLGPEQRPVAIPGLLQVGPELTDQARVIQQHRAPLPALAQHVQMFVVGRQVQVLQVHPQRLGDAQPRLEDQAEQEPIPPLGRRDHLQDRFHRPTAQGPRAGRIGADARDRGHRVGGDVALAAGPIQEARQGGLLAGAAGRAEPFRAWPRSRGSPRR